MPFLPTVVTSKTRMTAHMSPNLLHVIAPTILNLHDYRSRHVSDSTKFADSSLKGDAVVMKLVLQRCPPTYCRIDGAIENDAHG